MRVASYLAGDVLRHTFAVSIVLLAIIITGRFVKYLAEAASGELAAEVLLPIMFYRLPGFLELLLPLGLFIGILMAYGRLYVESEMVILSACGIGPGRMATYTLLPALLIALVVAGLALVLTPRGAERSEALLNDPNALQSLQLLAAGRFQGRGGDGSVTYAGLVDGVSGELGSIFAYSPEAEARADRQAPGETSVEAAGGTGSGESDEYARDREVGTVASVLRAERGRIVHDPASGTRYLELEDGYRFTGAPGRADFQVVAFKRYGERLPDVPVLAPTQPVDARATDALWTSTTAEDQAALHWRLSLIVMVPIVALLALALSKTNHRRGRYLVLAPALLLHLVYLFSLATIRSRVAEEGAPLAQFWLLHGGFFLLALALLFAPGFRRRVRSAHA